MPWSDQELLMLKDALTKYGKDWQMVAEFVGRLQHDCSRKAKEIHKKDKKTKKRLEHSLSPFD